MVEDIVDPTSSYTLEQNSVTKDVNTPTTNVTSNLRSFGRFTGGLTAAGTSLPTNQNAAQDAVYAGGIGIAQGICLGTGAASDSDVDSTGNVDRGVGAEGPNNGALGWNPGEIGITVVGESDLPQTDFIDRDFDKYVFGDTMTTNPQLKPSGDPTVLRFKVTRQKPGFLRLRFVFGSDEYPAWIKKQFNDSFAILVRKENVGATSFENIAVFKEPGNSSPMPFSLHAAKNCGYPLFKENQVAPSADFTSPISEHAIDDTPGEAPFDYLNSIPYYDHEFGSFTMPLTREADTPLSIGTYTIKIVVHDVGDSQVDSALFIENDGLRLFSLNPGDYNGDGKVGNADYQVWGSHFGQSPATFYEGDGNGNGIVDAADYVIWRNHQRESGPADFKADFDRNGCVDGDDFLLWQRFVGMAHCASRFEGDADGDGDVDNADLAIWQAQVGMCSGFDSMRMASSSSQNSTTDVELPESADMDGDGEVSKSDLVALNKIILGSGDQDASAAAPQPEPALAEP